MKTYKRKFKLAQAIAIDLLTDTINLRELKVFDAQYAEIRRAILEEVLRICFGMQIKEIDKEIKKWRESIKR